MRADSIQGLLSSWQRSRMLCYSLTALAIIGSAVVIAYFMDLPVLGLAAIGFITLIILAYHRHKTCLLYTSPSPRDLSTSRMPSSA